MSASSNPVSNHLPLFVADVLRYDIEQVHSITKLLNNTEGIGWRRFWPRDFTDAEVVEALRHLVREGLVEILVFDSQCNQLAPSASTPNFEGALEEYWFRLNDAGRTKWEQWEPPREPM